MSLNLPYRFVALFMAFSILISTSGISMDAHFCTGKVKRISLFGKAKTCKEVAASLKSCCSAKKKNAVLACSKDKHEKGCCSNQGISLKADWDFIKSKVNQVEFNFETTTAVVTIIKYTLKRDLIKNPVPYLNFKPPLLLKQILSLHQIYRL